MQSGAQNSAMRRSFVAADSPSSARIHENSGCLAATRRRSSSTFWTRAAPPNNSPAGRRIATPLTPGRTRSMRGGSGRTSASPEATRRDHLAQQVAAGPTRRAPPGVHLATRHARHFATSPY